MNTTFYRNTPHVSTNTAIVPAYKNESITTSLKPLLKGKDNEYS